MKNYQISGQKVKQQHGNESELCMGDLYFFNKYNFKNFVTGNFNKENSYFAASFSAS